MSSVIYVQRTVTGFPRNAPGRDRPAAVGRQQAHHGGGGQGQDLRSTSWRSTWPGRRRARGVAPRQGPQYPLAPQRRQARARPRRGAAEGLILDLLKSVSKGSSARAR
jgi:hypothetical protein